MLGSSLVVALGRIGRPNGGMADSLDEAKAAFPGRRGSVRFRTKERTCYAKAPAEAGAISRCKSGPGKAVAGRL